MLYNLKQNTGIWI